MRSEPGGQDDAADGASLDEIGGLDRSAILESLAVQDRDNALRVLLNTPYVGKLLERGHARLVQHHVLAVLHRLDRDAGALVRDHRADNQSNRWIVVDFLGGPCKLRVGEPLGELGYQLWLLRVERHQRAAASRDRLDLPIDVIVIQAERSEPNPSRAGRRLSRARACD